MKNSIVPLKINMNRILKENTHFCSKHYFNIFCEGPHTKFFGKVFESGKWNRWYYNYCRNSISQYQLETDA